MTSSLGPESWRRVNEVFHLALALPADERAAAVAAACPDDPQVCAEALSLLAAHERAGRFIDEPASAPAQAGGPPMSGSPRPAPIRAPGSQVGPYRIERVIGQGGMGVVYQAVDLRLGRVVALKAVESGLAGDSQRRERLRREAKAAAAISHPTIATVYALEELGGDVFIATEFVEGETLRAEIARGGQPAARVIETAIELAEGLDAAHVRGVVHRDFKPENVMRTPAGRLKILDFGLAIRRDAGGVDTRLTLDGAIIGTPAYMSPEQIRGEALDGRSDLFALGIVLHELFTGSHPFQGADAAATIACILESRPAGLPGVSGSNGDEARAAAGLIRAIQSCLEKSRAARVPTADALATSLRRLRTASGSDSLTRAGAAHATGRRDPIWWWKFHQAATIASYAVLLLPLGLSYLALGHIPSLWLGLAGFVPAVVASVLRLHLLFTWQSLPREWPVQWRKTRPWIRVADFAYALVLAGGGVAVVQSVPAIGVVLIGAAICVLLGALVIEPATSQAAFPE
jgi:serine/threonine protein kinase